MALRARRVWSAPLAVHAAVLVALMIGVAAFIGTRAAYTDDEGAGILQAQVIEHGRWTLANPLPMVDPTAADYPVHQPSYGTKGVAPLGKNLVYFLVLAGLGLLLGTAGMVGLSMAGTVAAALLSARLARELGGSERAAFWLVGLASPLFFDGFLVVAHSAAAALVAGSALMGLRFLRTGRALGWVVAVLCVGAATLLRTEAALWALGLAVGALLAAIGPRGARDGHRRRLALATGSTVAMLVARKASGLLTAHAIGMPLSPPAGAVPTTGEGGSVAARARGLSLSWLDLAHVPAAARVIVIVLLALVAVWARSVRVGRFGPRSTLALAGAVGAYSTYLAIAEPHQYVAGIAVVFPLLWAGLWMLGRPALGDTAARLLVFSSAAYALLVAVTEYSDAGAWQPGRYFFLAIPVMVPVVVVALASVLRALDRTTRLVAAACVLAGMLATATSAVTALRADHRSVLAMARAVRTVGSEASPGDGGLPVAVTTYPPLPRLEWATFPLVRWQLVDEHRLSAYGAALASAGIRRFVLVTPSPSTELAALAASYTPVHTVRLSLEPQWRLIVLQQR